MKNIKKCLAWLVIIAALAFLLFVISGEDMTKAFFDLLVLGFLVGIASLIVWAIMTLTDD